MKYKMIFAVLCFITLSACNAQNKKEIMPDKQKNPLICDPEKGICEIPGAGESSASIANNSKRPLRLIYFTDPICSACWSIEPQLRKLLLEYGEHFSVEYHMGGLLPSWEGFNGGGISKPSDVAHHWEEMSRYFDMPIDGDVWLKDPLNSSYPPCIAVKAAEIQSRSQAANFLRRIREMVFLEKKNITRWEHIKQAAFETGLDTARLANDYNGAALQDFREDLNLAAKYGVRGFPAIFFSDSLNNQVTVYGYHPYEDFEQAIKKLGPGLNKRVYVSADDHLFRHFSSLTEKEFSVLANITKEEAKTRLDELGKKGKIEKFESKNGILWRKRVR
jgi:putative protein-disulfide isomerase